MWIIIQLLIVIVISLLIAVAHSVVLNGWGWRWNKEPIVDEILQNKPGKTARQQAAECLVRKGKIYVYDVNGTAHVIKWLDKGNYYTPFGNATSSVEALEKVEEQVVVASYATVKG